MKGRRPILLGIVGDSAAGKTTLTRGLVNVLGPERVTHVCTDDYHKYDRQERAQLGITPLHPDCNYMDVMELHLERLHYGQPILKPVYDHKTGTLVRPVYVPARDFVIVEGLLAFSSPVARQFFDVKVFLDPPEDLRWEWKMRRDTAKRGYNPEEVLAERLRREPDSKRFIRPQREHADIVVSFAPADPCATGVPERLNGRLVLRPTLNHPDLGYLVEKEGDPTPGVRLKLARDSGRPADVLEIDGNVTAEHAAELEAAIWHHAPDLRPVRPDQFGVVQDCAEVKHSPTLALSQLLIAYHLLRKYNDIAQLPFAPAVAALRRIHTTPALVPGGG